MRQIFQQRHSGGMLIARNQGLTLVELIVVVWIVGILAIITATSFDITGWLDSYRLRNSAKMLFMNMQKARMHAIKENRDWAIHFDIANSAYCFQTKDSGGNWTDQGNSIHLDKNVSYGHGAAIHDATDDENPFPSDEPSAGVTFTGDRATFDSLGLPSKSGYCYLAGDNGSAYAIGTNNAGVIKLRKWKNNGWE
jgi:prepilin-type N-terminal cleavage/methylation domain-containing protein